MDELYALTDYKGFFGSKKTARPPNSGMDLNKLKESFSYNGITLNILPVSDIDFRNGDSYKAKFVIYTSAEDPDSHYKVYLNNILYGLKLCGAVLIPDYDFLLAHDNKVFMEILRDLKNLNVTTGIYSKTHGAIEDLSKISSSLKYPIVIKTSAGSMGRGVKLAQNEKELLKNARKLSYSPKMRIDYKEFLRTIKYPGYTKHSRHRKSFITQNFIDGLKHDWKVLVYGNKYYALKRENRKNDFRASGSGLFQFEENLPKGLLDFAEKIFATFNVPNISLDVAVHDNSFILIEFQAVYYGTTTIEKSPFYFIKSVNEWQKVIGYSVLEEVYANSVSAYINKLRHANMPNRNSQKSN